MTPRFATLPAATLALGLAAPLAAGSPELPRLGVSMEATSVLGVSSGGYMATQLAVAWPERFRGLAVLAAGPWGCARGSLGLALGQCMTTRRGEPDLRELEERYRDYRQRDLVGDPEALAELRVFIWHGEADETVTPSLGRTLAEQFRGWLTAPDDQLRFVVDEGIGHGWPVSPDKDTPLTELAECRTGGGTHLLACDRDIAGEALAWLHDEPPSARPAAGSGGTLQRFDQSDFSARGLDDDGYLFVPDACQGGGCALSVVLHGCGMGSEQIDMTFVRHNGLNEWASVYRRIVLYPQAQTSLANPQGCWDWWGFAESTWQLAPLHDSREGSQMSALMAMIDRLQRDPD